MTSPARPIHAQLSFTGFVEVVSGVPPIFEPLIQKGITQGLPPPRLCFDNFRSQAVGQFGSFEMIKKLCATLIAGDAIGELHLMIQRAYGCATGMPFAAFLKVDPLFFSHE